MTTVDERRVVTSRVRDAIRRTSGVLASLAALWTIWLLAQGGGSVTVLGLRVRSHDPIRPLMAAILAAAVFLLAGGRSTLVAWIDLLRPHAIAFWQSTLRSWRAGVLQHVLAGALALALFIVGFTQGSTAAGGSDSYGYLSQAELWLNGRVSISQPWVKDAPWPNAAWGFAPLGFKPAPPTRFTYAGYGPTQDPWAIVPTYSPGMPLLMALGKLVGGSCGPFVVVPLGGALLVLSTYLLGMRLGSRTLGLLAAVLVAASPPFLLMHFVNMTDVPVAGAFALACWFALGTTMRSAVGAAAALAIALVIRPNLAPVVPVFALWLTWRVVSRSPERWRNVGRVAIVLAGTGAGLGVTALIYWFTYGTPFESGYGPTAAYFDLAHIAPNVRNYTQWFTEVHTPLAFIGLLALALPVRAAWPDVRDRSAIVAFGAITAIVIGMFLIYLVLDNSSYLRFFLVCYPFIMLGLASVAMALARVHRIAGPIIATVLVGVVVAKGLMTAQQWQVLDQGLIEAKFADVAQHVRRETPENSVVLAMNHSGSLRYYAGRVTLRWDNMQVDWLDRAVAWMADHGVRTYVLVDEFERVDMVKYFKGQKLMSVLEGPPVFRFGDKVFFDLGLPPGREIETVELPVRDIGPKCWTPFPPPALVWKQP